jgi:hypothetical protein
MSKTPKELTDEIAAPLKANNAAGLVIVYKCTTMEESAEQVNGQSHYQMVVDAELPFSNAFLTKGGIHFKMLPEWSPAEKSYRYAATVNMMEGITTLGGHVLMQMMEVTQKLSNEYNKNE